MDDIRDILSANRVVPVVVLDRVQDTAPLCEALLQGGIHAIEVTLRTEAAMAAIGEAAKRFPDMIVGAGTLLNAEAAPTSTAARCTCTRFTIPCTTS